MYKTILIPIDLAHPEKGEPMIEVAKNMGNKDTRFVLVNVVEEMPGYVSAELPEELFENAYKYAGKKLKSIAEKAGIKSDNEVHTGNAHSTILSVAKEQKVDLIIVGSHKPGLQDYFLGSTAARVVRHADCTVLVMR